MSRTDRRFLALTLIALVASPALPAYGDAGETTRVDDPKQHAFSAEAGGYPYREKTEYILKELDLKPGDVVVDVGAGDGFWALRMAECVGRTGAVHAMEVEQEKVDKLKEVLADLPQAHAYLGPTDGTDLPEDSCDLAFLSKTYHHLTPGQHVDYLRHLHAVVKPTGRLVMIERHRGLSAGRSQEHAWPPGLMIQQAEEAGWIPVRYELITGTYHFIAVFVQKSLFPVEPEQPRRQRPANRPPRPEDVPEKVSAGR